MSLLGSWFSYLAALIRTRAIVINDYAFSLYKTPSIIRTLVCTVVRSFGLTTAIYNCIYFVSGKLTESSWNTKQQLNKRVGPSYRCFLALDGSAVEAQGRHIVGLPLDVEDTLVVPLSWLWLREVLGS